MHAANAPEVLGLLRIRSIRALPFSRRRGQSVAINGKSLSVDAGLPPVSAGGLEQRDAGVEPPPEELHGGQLGVSIGADCAVTTSK